MRVIDIRVTPVTVPMEAPLRWSMGVETGTTRAIIELFTDEGIIGLGETYGGNAVVHALDVAKPLLLGLDPLEVGVLQRRLGVFSISYETSVPPVVRAGLEMACLDAAGKALGRSVSALLGGQARDRVETAAYLFYRYRSADGRRGGEDNSEGLVTRAHELIERCGCRVLKLKGGVLPPEEELRTLLLLRARFPALALRWDPNAAWSVETAALVALRLEQERLGLEYLEDPTAGLDGMRRVRQRARVPLATNMCVVSFDQLAPGIRLEAIDVLLADVHYWGGLRANQKMLAVCEAFQLGVGMHSDRELGISTAAMLHLAAAYPQISYAIDSHYHDQVDDVIAEPFQYREGYFSVPEGPGLGIELDPDKVAKYHRLYCEQGAVNEFYDARRPTWVPALPLF